MASCLLYGTPRDFCLELFLFLACRSKGLSAASGMEDKHISNSRSRCSSMAFNLDSIAIICCKALKEKQQKLLIQHSQTCLSQNLQISLHFHEKPHVFSKFMSNYLLLKPACWIFQNSVISISILAIYISRKNRFFWRRDWWATRCKEWWKFRRVKHYKKWTGLDVETSFKDFLDVHRALTGESLTDAEIIQKNWPLI